MTIRLNVWDKLLFNCEDTCSVLCITNEPHCSYKMSTFTRSEFSIVIYQNEKHLADTFQVCIEYDIYGTGFIYRMKIKKIVVYNYIKVLWTERTAFLIPFVYVWNMLWITSYQICPQNWHLKNLSRVYTLYNVR
jgi:hypothetical protein